MTPAEWFKAILDHHKRLRYGDFWVVFPRHPLSSYPDTQVRTACLMAAHLGRGVLVIVEDPKDAG